MNKMKKFLSLLMALAMTVSVSACLVQGNESTGGSSGGSTSGSTAGSTGGSSGGGTSIPRPWEPGYSGSTGGSTGGSVDTGSSDTGSSNTGSVDTGSSSDGSSNTGSSSTGSSGGSGGGMDVEIPTWTYSEADKITYENGALGSANYVITEDVEHKVGGTQYAGVHSINVQPTNNVFAENNQTDYKVVVPTDIDPNVAKASNLLVKRLNESTGASFIKVTEGDTTYNDNNKYIYFCCDDTFTAQGLEMPSQKLGATGYYIKSKGNNVFIQVESVWGANNGAIGFLMETVGYEMYSDDVITYDYEAGDRITLPTMEIIDKPDFEFFMFANSATSDTTAGMRYSQTGVFCPIGGERWHNAFEYLPKDTYWEGHKNWYNNTSSKDGATQLCYTAHGNTTEYNAMVNEVFNVLKTALDANPTLNDVTLTNEDNGGVCTCPACAANKSTYGADSANNILFCNDVAEKLEEYYGPKGRTIRLCFFAYQLTTDAPTKGGITMHDNVGVFYAPIDAQYNKSFYHTNNSRFAKNMTSWAKLTKHMYLWLYETNYDQYMYPINTYDTIVETYRFARTSNAVYLFPEGQYNQGNVTHFTKYKEYLDAKVLWDLDQDVSKITDDFFTNYFGPAAGPMRTFFEELQAQLEWIEANNPEIDGKIYNKINKAAYWPKRQLDHWLELTDEAFDMIEHLRVLDPKMYEVFEEHINLEKLFPLYAQIELYSTSYSDKSLTEKKEEFKKIARSLQVTHYSEWDTCKLSELYAKW